MTPRRCTARLVMLTIFINLATFMEVLEASSMCDSGDRRHAERPNEGTGASAPTHWRQRSSQPLTGWLGRRFGEVRTFMPRRRCSCCSRRCAGSPPPCRVVVGRLLQGAVSGPMVPMAQALLMRNYPLERRGVAMASGEWW
jgi:DHA2 family multidrug resistance protein